MVFQKRAGFIFFFRLLSVSVLTCSFLACFGTFLNVTFDKEPIVEQFLGYNCSQFPPSVRPKCLELEVRHYSLWGIQDEFTIYRREGLCARIFPLADNFNGTGSVKDIVGGNFGQCSDAVMITTQVFAVLTVLMACCLVIWITTISDHHEEGHFPVKVHLWLSASTMVCSIVVVLVYCIAINPLRLDPTFCETQTFFSVCVMEMGTGFWFQVATLVLIVITLIASLIARKKSIWGYERSSQQQQAEPRTRRRHFLNFYDDLHFWIKMGRLGEFTLMLMGAGRAFTTINATFSPGALSLVSNVKTIEIANRINLWEGVFCTHHLLWWSFLIDKSTDTFGHCSSSALFHVQFATAKVLISSGLALVLKRDAKENPFFYLIGIIMDFLSLIFISIAIGIFYSGIFPGRKEIQPSYCSIWAQYLGTECSIELGSGFFVYCSVLILTTINFVGEFIVAERSQIYGARSAWHTVYSRVRQGRFKSVHKPTSFIAANIGPTADHCVSEDNKLGTSGSTVQLGVTVNGTGKSVQLTNETTN